MDYRQAAQDFALYLEAAEAWEGKAESLSGPARAEALRKAMVYRGNAETIHKAAGGLLKAFPIKRKLDWKGMKIAIENPAGSYRQWKDRSGAEGQTFMLHDYGYLRSTAAVDGDAVDVFVGPRPDTAQNVYVVRQLRAPDFRFYDEDKCMIGFDSPDHAKMAYLSHYTSPKFFGGMDVFPVDLFVSCVKQTKKAPAPVGGWNSLMVPQRMDDHPMLQEEAAAHIKQGEVQQDDLPEEAAPHYIVPKTASHPADAQPIHDGSGFVVLVGPATY